MANMSPKERKTFYLGALVNAPYLAGIVYIARHIQSDKILSADDRAYLMRTASERYKAVSGRDLFFDL